MVKPHLHHYQVVGRESPSEKTPEPTVYKFEVFAPNFVVAKSRFWRMMKIKNKVKATHGDVLSCKVVKDAKLAARNYVVDIAYYSQRCGYTRMVKEFRDVSKSGAVSQAYHDLASRHRARYHNIEVLEVKSIPDHEVKHLNISQYHVPNLSFPLLQRRVKAARKDRAIFVKKNTKRAMVA
ncbi:putative 60S ribosomal protein L18a [Leptomonas pyrrhocoris]|uniref:60S ribosomal protein L18a n=1 Tax=Leptomonas pyrrhocoris TaxID=157538 RepID=A0A0N0VGX7_LEPPY|nr:putative 60S ribosomal protein L18a [Leptomonas pyrrhocoris]XP_015663043.1 putative 60S ribosomal protein L18a [Leptomonas pyrrhocoris]XP_015664360.1 putative 60S ribosomal protein L18a [Leptomonas pyrrhocoris]XP_015664361.1 putative 60S ribosomal protein L18a [Leptomonas pyrrhocoris]XP_015664362.1 putative 60S ribosomal protein L18a [Leptomonas pyrrhocoris]KPA84603.1 putative 60S ribosomal protein L18a [Leptomonas pyrrhocoris]KPA84604.1 putative 60S ribosomal protein L18a [Leptomonas pyrr|eukprot:XP_015663042.1 putative 60S ribosomal protein L18a [Leptomonas pyrrhocoris]